MRRQFLCFSAVFLLISITAQAQELKKQTWKVGDLEREALIHIPETAKAETAPVVFAFHGHGGNSTNAGKSFRFHQHWPEAIVVYPQGVKTPGLLTDPEGLRTGWQSYADAYGGRDLNFFDAMLAWLRKEYKVDDNRIYSTGHSNGGGFTYLLWAERGKEFAAMGPSAAIGLKLLPKLTPKPMIHIAGEADPLVKIEWQRQMISLVKEINATVAEGKRWQDVKNATVYESPDGRNVVTLIHPGKHNYLPASSEAIVKFFKATAKVAPKPTDKP
ncbi:MAG: alpha/beta hydrolase family esterase [bacterium]